jgi:hypothetical protein
MTAHPHDPSSETADSSSDGSVPAVHHEPAPARPWWLLPALLAGALAAGLVIAGLVSPSTAISVGLVGGMMLMHLGGHGHGGHGGHGGGGPPPPVGG